MTLFNGNYDNCIYRNGKPIICTAYGSMVKGGLCLTCDFREKNLYNCDPNEYSFYNSNYFPRPQYENYLCNLCGNNSHDGYDCQQQFPFVHEQELNYNQNYDETSDDVFQANHSIQNEESFENSSSNQEKEEPAQEFDLCQLIRKECCVEASEEQKQSMEDTMLELVKICQEKEFLCIHDDVDDLIESALNSKLLLINSNSQRLDKKEQEVKNVVEQPSNAENLLPIPSKYEVTLEDKKECDLPISENSPVCDNHSDTFSDSKINDDISVYDDDFEDIEHVEALLPDPEIISIEEENSVEEENVVQQAEEEVDLEDISQIHDIVLREKFLSIIRLISNIESLNDNSTLDRIEPDQEKLINLVESDILDDSTNDPLLEESDLFLAVDHSIPPEPPDTETDAGEEIPVVMNDKDEDVDNSSFIFFMFDKVFSLLSAESEDMIFDPGISN
uniref:Uncharacterized protein n=1 Tax=Tanacetum cinerariifolium TaxID=118510 RepID=A0A699GKS2_TANCI|nr:hypothetical protein [Tanacetum cinerariifolium]